MYIACSICGKSGIIGVCPKCEHIAERYKALENRCNKAESYSYWVKQKLTSLLRETSQQIEENSEYVSVHNQLLRDLIDVAASKRKEGIFWQDTLLTSLIVCDAADMLRSRGTNMFPKVFGMLKKHVEEYFNLHGWKDESLEPGTKINRNIWDAPPIK